MPISVTEQIESTHAAYEAGASICHAHVRNDDGSPSTDVEKFAALKSGIEKNCPGMIIQFSTGGRSGAGRQRGGMLQLQPAMASLAVGSNNFPTRVYENDPELIDWLAGEMQRFEVKPEIEVFDVSHLFTAAEMHSDGRIPESPYIQFVMGVKNAMPADKRLFDFLVESVARLLPSAEWCAAGIGRHQLTLNEWAAAAGGHMRTGLEDNVRLDKHTLAPSNAALVKRAVEICDRYERPVASVREARQILGVSLKLLRAGT